jgi:hypothetical protein
MNLKMYFIIFIFLVMSQKFYGYRWPVEDFNEQHDITASFGEPRPVTMPYSRFHSGIDIGEGIGTRVYHVSEEQFVISDVRRYGQEDPYSPGVWQYPNYNNSYVEIGVFFYTHIRPTQQVINEAQLSLNHRNLLPENTLLGDIYYPGSGTQHHLHFEDGHNPFRNDALTPYIDNAVPTIQAGSDGLRFYHAQTNIVNQTGQIVQTIEFEDFIYNNNTLNNTRLSAMQFNNTVSLNINGQNQNPLRVYGKVDAVGNFNDRRTGSDGNATSQTTGNIGLYMWGYELYKGNPSGNGYNFEFVKENKILFDGIPGNSPQQLFYLAYLRQNLADGYYSYLLCNDLFDRNGNGNRNEYLNTAQREESAFNVNARHNSETKFPDGVYKFRAVGADTDSRVSVESVNTDGRNRTVLYNGNDGPRPVCERDRYLLIDNFAPYVRRAVITNSTGPVYDVEYVFNNATGMLEKKVNRQGTLSGDLGMLHITVFFSETMQTPTVKIRTVQENVANSFDVNGSYQDTEAVISILACRLSFDYAQDGAR